MTNPDNWTTKRRAADAWKPDPATNWPALPDGVPDGPTVVYDALKATAAPPQKAEWAERMRWRHLAFCFLVDAFYGVDEAAAPELEALMADAVKRLGTKWFEFPDGIDALHEEAFRLADIGADA